MRKAKVHIPLIDGIYSGNGRCYEIDPPFIDPDSGAERRFITTVVQPGITNHQFPDVLIFAADEKTGAATGFSMKRLPGSTTLHFHPETDEDGWHYGLIAFGVTGIVDEFEKPEPKPSAFPDGLDYDPSVVPTYE